MRPPVISIVIPCYNESAVLPISLPKMLGVLDAMCAEGIADKRSYILCSNDGSRDDTWDIITHWHTVDNRVKGVSLAHNRGHQYALLAGLESAMDHCDAAVSIDADLQDDPEAIVEMVKLFNQGSEIVFGVRDSRESDTWFKRTTARGFYKFQNAMGLNTIYDHADYRLMSNRALHMLADYGESNLFLRGIVAQLGLKTSIVRYDRAPRAAGESKYPLGKMLSFSIEGITSLSARPMRLIFLTGLTLLLLDIAVALYVLFSYFGHQVISGWASQMLSIWFLGSLLLMCLGIVGEYVGKIFIEVKKRPRYHIEKTLID